MSILTLLQSAAAPTLPDASAWALAGKVATICVGIIAATGLFIGKAVSRAIWRSHLSDCGPDVKKAVEEIFADDITARDAAIDLVRVHEDRLEYLDAAIQAQGKALTDTITRAIEAQTAAMQHSATATTSALSEIRTAVEKVHDEAVANATAIADVVGFLRGRDAPDLTAPERRAPHPSRRRKGDLP
jgi:hypothetical protein